MTAPDVSVAVATVRRPERLAVCLGALLGGRLRPAEVVVVDQGADPRTAEVVGRFRNSAVPVRHVVQRARGLAASRNAGLRACSSEIVAVTDDDCRADPGWIEAVSAAFESRPELVAVTGRVLADGLPEEGRALSLRTDTTSRTFSAPTDPWLVGTGANFAVRRRMALAAGGYDERLGTGSPGRAAEDLELIHRLLRSGAEIRYEPKALVLHARQSDDHRRATRWGYGYGIGAFCGICARRRDRLALPTLGHWAEMRTRFLWRGVRDRDVGRVREEVTVLLATVAGVPYGLRIGARRPEGIRR